MRVATWNINHVNKRIELLVDWLRRTQPDVVALQELKCPTAQFPTAAIETAGYSAVVVGQRAWNGVALLCCEHEPLPVITTLPGDATDKEARYVEAAINGVLYACLYLPNGNPQPGPKFDYKLRWFERLRLRTQELWDSGYPVVLLGDWNVVPTDADIYKPDPGATTHCCSRSHVRHTRRSWSKAGPMPSHRSTGRVCPSPSGTTAASDGSAMPACASTTS